MELIWALLVMMISIGHGVEKTAAKWTEQTGSSSWPFNGTPDNDKDYS